MNKGLKVVAGVPMDFFHGTITECVGPARTLSVTQRAVERQRRFQLDGLSLYISSLETWKAPSHTPMPLRWVSSTQPP